MSKLDGLYIKKEWYDLKEAKTFEEAIELLDFICSRGEDPQWSIQYYGFGEHFTFWSGYGHFIDFHDIGNGGIDRGTTISWVDLKKIIIESANSLLEDIKKNCTHLFEKEVKP